MLTRTTVDGVRVTIESYEHTCGTRWQWSTEDGRLVMGFTNSAETYRDVVDALGAGVRIVRHGEGV